MSNLNEIASWGPHRATRVHATLMTVAAMTLGCSSAIETPDLTIPENLPRIEATTVLGTARGVQEGEVLAFYGLPYAAPVAGLDRFLPPKPPAPYDGVFDATDYGPACAQVEGSTPGWMETEKTHRYKAYLGFDDIVAQPKGPGCLNLNLWTASLASSASAPVLVFLHGGGLNQGSNRSANFHGANLAKKGVVVVNINYRLGIQGFLAGGEGFEGDTLVPNRGVMDMLAALKWVQANIAAFGGDPMRVTVAGESGGAFAVWALLSSPASDGLLHRAIVQSAPPYMTPAKDLEAVSRDLLRDDLGVAPGDTAALAALTNSDIPHTVLSQKLFSGDKYGWLSQNNLPFNGAYGTDLIPLDTLGALRAGRSSKVDVMIGINKHEARGLTNLVPMPDALAIKITKSFLAGMIGNNEAARERVTAAYEERLMPGASGLEVDEQILKDATFRQPSIRAAEIRNQAGAEGKTYMYEFNWESPCCDGGVGAIHALEIAFAFDNMKAAEMLTMGDATAQPLATAMSDAWVNFAKNGVPASSGLPEWPAYDEQTRQTMLFDRESKVVSDPEAKFREFWAGEYAAAK